MTKMKLPLKGLQENRYELKSAVFSGESSRLPVYFCLDADLVTGKCKHEEENLDM